MKVMVTGGAGYIGSHATKRLIEAGHEVVVADNLFRGHRAAVHPKAAFEKLDLLDTAGLIAALGKHGVECVMHFAALAYVGESVTTPLWYYENNTSGTVSLLKAIDAAGVSKMVFSSTCATYGQPDKVPITEETFQSPINPYGWSKLFIERVLADYAHAKPSFGYAALRYFNVAGSAADGTIGEDHTPETHIIPVLLNAALGKVPKVSIHGEDYPTPDGTCIRDYVHVEDLVDAHILVAKALKAGDKRFYNLGIGKGMSVKEMVDSAKRVTGVDFKVEVGPRRAGDPPMLYADASKIGRELGWKPRYTEIDGIVETAWRWFKANPEGYKK
jgi:UDP-glucose 4-epimerase